MRHADMMAIFEAGHEARRAYQDALADDILRLLAQEDVTVTENDFIFLAIAGEQLRSLFDISDSSELALRGFVAYQRALEAKRLPLPALDEVEQHLRDAEAELAALKRTIPADDLVATMLDLDSELKYAIRDVHECRFVLRGLRIALKAE